MGRRRINPPMARNEELRAHVTRVGFNLTLARSQIAALVFVNESTEQGGSFLHSDIAASHRRIFNLFATGMGGLHARGLVVHHYDPEARNNGAQGLGPHYTITRAGELVIELLRETGLYAEYAGALPPAYRNEVAS